MSGPAVDAQPTFFAVLVKKVPALDALHLVVPVLARRTA